MARLPSELVSLVHHIHLNRSGWWNDAMERLVLATFWLSDAPLPPDGVVEAIRRHFDVAVNSLPVSQAVARLRARGELMSLPNRALKIAEQRRHEFERERQRGAHVEERARRRFTELVEESGTGLDGDGLWVVFTERLLYPAVCSEGARLYDLLTGSLLDWTSVYERDLEEFLEAVPSEHRSAVRAVVASFLGPEHAVRAFLLRLMDAYFVVEASRLDPATIEGLAKLSGQRPTFTVFLDTNILFSVLGLHGRAARESADLLISLADRVSDLVQVRLYALPITIEETRAAMQRELGSLSRVHLSPKTATGAMATGSLGDVAVAYAEAVAAAGRPIPVAEFLNPYIRSLREILARKGIELYNARLDELSGRPDVLADVEQQLASERTHGESGKTRSQVLHDTVLWHFVRERRPQVVESPTDAHFWVVTEDHRLIAFDQAKLAGDGAHSVPTCLKPLGLVQMLQLWVGRTAGMEQAIVGGLRLSFLVPSFDHRAEQATVKILEVLSRFENVEDLQQSTITNLLLNEALQLRLCANSDDEEQQIALVKEALIEEQRRILAEGAAAIRAEQERRSRAERERLEMASALQQRDRELGDARSRVVEMSEQLSAVQARLEESERVRREEEAQRELRAVRRAFALRWLLAPLLAAAVVGAVYAAAAGGAPRDWRVATLAASALMAAWLVCVTWLGGRRKEIADWKVYEVIRKVHGLLLGVILVGVISSAMWDWWKPLLGGSDGPAVKSAGAPSAAPGREQGRGR